MTQLSTTVPFLWYRTLERYRRKWYSKRWGHMLNTNYEAAQEQISGRHSEKRQNHRCSLRLMTEWANGIARIWGGTKRGIDSDAPKAWRLESTGGFTGAQSGHDPLNFSHNLFEKKCQRTARTFCSNIFYFKIQFIISQNKLGLQIVLYRPIHLCSNQFTLENLCFIIILPRPAICYISFHLASKFNTEIHKNCSTYGDVPTSPEPLIGLRPWTPSSSAFNHCMALNNLYMCWCAVINPHTHSLPGPHWGLPYS